MKKRMCIIIGLEIIMVVIAIVFASRVYQQNKVNITYEQSDFQSLAGGSECNYYIDTGMENFKDVRIGIPELTLPKGSYNVTLQYQCKGSGRCGMVYCHGFNDYDISGDVKLSELQTEQTTEVMVKMNREPAQLFVRLYSECVEGDYILVERATISSTFIWYRLQIFILIFCLLMADVCLFFFENRKKITISIETKKVLVCLGGIALLAGLPLMLSYLASGDQDLRFHLARIEGLKEGLLAGQFPVRIQPQWLNNHGYPVSIFYGDLLLYLPAVLRLGGVSLENSYKLFVIVINVATAGISYYCFRRISGSRKAGIVVAFFYTLNLYRLTNLYVRAAVGEYCASMFFPIILFGLWYIFTQEIEKIKQSKVWIFMTLGYLGVLYSHLISCEIVGIFTILVCLFQIKKIFQKERFMALFKAFLGIAVGGFAFILPMLQYMQFDFVTGDLSRFVLYQQEERGMFWGQFFTTKYNVLALSRPSSAGMAGEMPMTLGTVFVVLLFAVIYVSICCYRNIQLKKQWFVSMALLALSMWLCTKNFPFAFFAKNNHFFKLIILSLQYPFRFLTVVVLFISFLLVIMLSTNMLSQNEKEILGVVVCILLLIDSVNFMSEVMNTNGVDHTFDKSNIDSFAVSGGEYLYSGTNLNDYVNDITNIGEGVTASISHRGSIEIAIQAANLSETEQTLELPLILYKGYQAKDIKTKNEFFLSDGNSHRIVLHLPPKYEGMIEVKYIEPWYWRVVEIISLSWFVVVSVLIILYRKANTKHFKNNEITTNQNDKV